jgi:hypothetical protein
MRHDGPLPNTHHYISHPTIRLYSLHSDSVVTPPPAPPVIAKLFYNKGRSVSCDLGIGLIYFTWLNFLLEVNNRILLQP